MLIECNECKNKISDKAESCPHCGIPVKLLNMCNYCNINGIKYDFSEIINILPQVGELDTDVSPIYIIGSISRLTSLDWEASKELANIIIETKEIPNEFNGKIEIKQNESNVPKCPTCGSTDLSKLSTAGKVAKIAAFGIFGMGDNGKTWKCNNCGSRW